MIQLPSMYFWWCQTITTTTTFFVVNRCISWTTARNMIRIELVYPLINLDQQFSTIYYRSYVRMAHPFIWWLLMGAHIKLVYCISSLHDYITKEIDTLMQLCLNMTCDLIIASFKNGIWLTIYMNVWKSFFVMHICRNILEKFFF